jgi:beta-galactosidase/beta-glucuronidase
MSGTLSTRPLHPRPQFERADWSSLDGPWEFALDPDAVWTVPAQVAWQQTIRVPFSPETPASGIHNTSFFKACWYRRELPCPALKPGERLLLHFNAVDYAATVWINHHIAAYHEGGYTPFAVDITDELREDCPLQIALRAEDDPLDLSKPRGKQDWQLTPHSIWYPRTTGIWQTVWLERVPSTWIGHIRWTPCLERWEIGLEIRLAGQPREGMQIHVQLHVGDILLAQDQYTVVMGEIHRRIALSDPGIDDYRNELLWSPATPTIIQAQFQLWNEQGELVDTVQSYTALRSIGVQGDRFTLNGRPYSLRMVLDQGYWPETGLTAPDDRALRRDVQLAKAMGFNGVRKHQKIEDPRYLYWADMLGLLIWEEMPSAYRYTKRSIERLTREWTAVIERDFSHPCIIAWVPFNESWGVPDLPDSPAQRHYVQALYHLTKSLDPTRPVIGNDGWESVATDIIGIHDYDEYVDRISLRYGSEERLPRLFQRERPGGRLLVLDDTGHGGRPIMLSEFGGIACSEDTRHTWGYTRARTPEAFAEQYTRLMEVVRSLSIMTGFCYTQFSDTYQEANGLLYADRTPKFPLEAMAAATRGPGGAREREIEWAWRERIMRMQRQQYYIPPEDYRVQEDR